jgi:hypothetical protein
MEIQGAVFLPRNLCAIIWHNAMHYAPHTDDPHFNTGVDRFVQYFGYWQQVIYYIFYWITPFMMRI